MERFKIPLFLYSLESNDSNISCNKDIEYLTDFVNVIIRELLYIVKDKTTVYIFKHVFSN